MPQTGIPWGNGQTSLLGLLDESIQQGGGLQTELSALLEVLFGLVVLAQEDPD